MSRPNLNPYKEFVAGPSSQPEKNRLVFTSSRPFTPAYVQSELAKSTNLNAKTVYESRVQGRQIALENPLRESKAKQDLNAKRLRRTEEKKKRVINVVGRKEAKRTRLWKLDDNQAKYHLFLPLHQLWLGYMSELMNLLPLPSQDSKAYSTMPNIPNMQGKLVKADFHGCILTVRRSRNPDMVGLTGIVIHETENAFKVITKEDSVKLLPKQNSVFAFRIPLYDTRNIPTSSEKALDSVIPQMDFELYGNQFRFRAAERAGRKFKHKESIAL